MVSHLLLPFLLSYFPPSLPPSNHPAHPSYLPTSFRLSLLSFFPFSLPTHLSPLSLPLSPSIPPSLLSLHRPLTPSLSPFSLLIVSASK